MQSASPSVKQLFRPRLRVQECLSEIAEVLESGWTGQGPKCQAFESEFAAFVGAPHAVFMNSATAALHVALRCLDLPAGTKVITTPVTFVSTNLAIRYEGLEPAFCDIDPTTLCLSFDSVRNRLAQGDVGAVIWVHLGGQVTPDFHAVMDLIHREYPSVRVIEDCAHAAGAWYDSGAPEAGRLRVGGRTDTIACFSFQAVKNLPTADSGMLVTADPVVAERARRLAWCGINSSTFRRTGTGEYRWRYSVEEIGWKYNGNDVVAAIGRVQLRHLDHDNAYRRALYGAYRRELGDLIVPHNQGSAQHLISCLLPGDTREEAIARLRDAGFASGVHYEPNTAFPVFAPFYSPGSCPRMEACAPHILSLPNHLDVSFDDVAAIAAVIRAL